MKRINIEDLVRDTVKKLQPYSSARDEYKAVNSKTMVFLDANENPNNNGVNRYPDPNQTTLKEKLSHIKGVPAKNIVLGNGSDEILDLIFRAFCEPKTDSIITLPPTYGMYKVLANINAIHVIEVNLNEAFQPDVSRILKAVTTQTKLLFLCSPNNPTGNSFDTKLIEELLEKFNGIVVIDEAYIDFSNQESWLNKLNQYPNLIVTQTLSKAYGMAGIRLGICYASAAIVSILNKIKPPYNVNQLSQNKAIKRLKQEDEVAQEIKFILTERDKLISALKTIPFVTTIYKTDANFVLIKVDNATQRYNQLISKSIVIRNRTNQPLCDNCLRLTIGTTTENKQLINTLKTL